MARKQRAFSSEFKLQVVMEVFTGAKRPAEVCREHQIAGSVLSRWRQRLAELMLDLEKGLAFIRAAQGCGWVTVTLEVRRGGSRCGR